MERQEGEELESSEGNEGPSEGLSMKVLQLSLQSKEGLTSNHSFKVEGKIKDTEVVVLVDCGATTDFISSALTRSLKLTVLNTKEYEVEVGTGERVKNRGISPQLSIEVQGIPIQRFFVVDLGGSDVVLGLEWLSSLGEVKANFKNLELEWGSQDGKKLLKGDPSLCKSPTSWKALHKALNDEGEGFLLSYKVFKDHVKEEKWVCDKKLNTFLEEFDDLFHEPLGLPPKRSCDHTIALKVGTTTPNIRPYRYPYYQKNEIERFVKEMLTVGIIRPSNNPFSSPVIFVKKKDGGWRFCIDYRALNKLTIPDKFPIPIIDESLDELGGAQVFTKLDLKSGYHQIKMKEEDVMKTAFRTHEGHYEFL